MGVIRQLPPAIVNQIAAGEVVDRPASVVKELLENSIDAGATQISIQLEAGGRDLVQVVDNGSGIAPEDLPLAVSPHATSKLQSVEDLFRIRTLGFRGEALASIASVSHLRLESRVPGADEGYAIEVVGGEMSSVTACGCPPGTLVQVRHLFFNTPVRRKFLKSPQAEMGRVVEVFSRTALAYPHLSLSLYHGGKPLYELPPSTRISERIGLLFGRELTEHLLWVEANQGGYRLYGYVADPSQTRSVTTAQFFFLNGRFIRDRALTHALAEAYRGLIPSGRQPIAFLFLELPCEDVDVNVHPTKLEVRFRDAQRVYSLVLGTLRNLFLTTDLTHRLVTTDRSPHGELPPAAGPQPLAPRPEPASVPGQPVATPSPTPGVKELRAGDQRAEGIWRSLEAFYERNSGRDTPRRFDTLTKPGRSSASSHPIPFPRRTPEASPSPTGAAWATPDAAGPEPEKSSSAAALHLPNAIQVHRAYLVVEIDEGLMVIDQHALHERILFEELRQRLAQGPLESQRFLVPMPLELSSAEVALIQEYQDVLQQLGLEVELFGPKSVLLRSYPVRLAHFPADQLLRDVLDHLAYLPSSLGPGDLLHRLLQTMACKAAVKAGQRLSPEEMAALLEKRDLVHDHHHCPHGRPSALILTREELDRRFGRH
jgi:DNA mismatch repair protein MutL